MHSGSYYVLTEEDIRNMLAGMVIIIDNEPNTFICTEETYEELLKENRDEQRRIH